MNLEVERAWGDDVGVKFRAICLSILMLTSVLSVGGIGGVAAETNTCEVTVVESGDIQDAIDAAQQGDTICVAGGTYEEGLTITTDDLTLVAADGAQPILEGSFGIHGIHVHDATGVTIDGLVVRDFGNVGIYLEDAPSATVRNTEIRGNNGGIVVNRGNETTIESNVLENNEGGSNPFDVHGGIHITNSIGSVIENNEATGNTETNIYVRVSDEATIRGNTLGDAFSGQQGSLRVDESENALVENNTVTGNVGDELQRGIRILASTGATVVDNHVEGNDGAGLRIPNSNDLTVTGNTITNNWMGIDVGGAGDSTNLVIEANTVENSANAGIRIRTNGVTVRNNSLSGNQGSGVIVNDAREVVVRDNVIENSGISGVNVFGTSLTAREGIVEGNTISGSGQNGIRIDGPRDVTVRGNDVTSSGEHGITAIDTESIVIDDNEFSGSQLSGIYTDGAVNITVTENTVNANTESGILVRDTVSDGENREMRIGSNLVRDNVDGIRLWGNNLDNVPIESNRLESNTNGVTIAGNPTAEDALRVNQNAIQNNANRGINHQGDSQFVDITNNWWGDASGPSGEAIDRETSAIANGTGDSIEHDRFDNRYWFDPWLTTAPTTGSDPAPGQFDVAITGTNEPVTAGESLVVTATITNVGDEETTETVELVASDGATVLDTVEVTLDAEASDSITFTWETTEGDTGVFDLSVVSPSDSDTVTVTIDAPSAGAFFVVTIDDTNEPIAAGGTLEVSATVSNTGDEEGTQTIELVAFDGTVVDSTSLTLAAGATETLVLNWSDAPEGTGDVTVQSEDDDATRTVAIGTNTAVEVTSCRVIDTAGNYALSTNVTGGETCIQITASDVTFEGGGHTITASNATGSDWGVHVTGVDGRVENVTVTNVVLEGWDNGVRFRNVDNGEISNIVVENGATGVFLSASHGNELSDLTIRNNDRRGLSLSSSNDNVVSGLDATGNEADTTFGGRGSVYLSGSSTNAFEDVSVTDGRSGVRVSTSNNNEFVGITTERHANYGLEVQSNSNTFTDIIANDNGQHGVQVNRASFNNFENVSVTGTDGSAVRLTGIGSGSTPRDNVFENVSVTDNDGEAISLSVADSNTFRNVTTASNTGTAVTFVSRAEGNLVEFGEIDHGSNTAVNFGSDSVGNTIREISLHGTGTPFVAPDGAPNNEFDRVDIDETVVSVSARGVGSFRTSPSTLPADATPIDSYLGFTPLGFSTTHVEHLRFHYEAADVEAIDEDELAIWQLTGGEWVAPTDASYVTGVDTDQQYVFAAGIDESHLSATFGAFAAEDLTDPGEGGGSSGGGGGSGGGGSSGGGTVTPVEPEPEPDAPFFAVNIIDTTSPVTAGEMLDVTAVIENAGGENGTGPIELVVDGTVVDTAALSLSSGDEAAVTLSWATTADDAAETIQIEVRSDDDVATAVVTVEPVDETADIVLYNARAQSDTVDVGDTLTVVGDFYNLGTTGGERTVTLFVDGEAVDDATVTVSPGLARGAAQLTWTPTESDVPDGAAETDVTISLDGLLVGTVTVENPYSDIWVIAASATATDLVAGEEAYVIGSIYQSGTIAGSETFDLVAENAETGEEIVLGAQESPELAPGYYHLGALNVSYTIDEAGTYDLTLGDRDAGTIEVEAAYSDIQVNSASTSAIDLVAGEEAYVVGSVYQAGTIAGSETIGLTAENVDTGEEIVLGSQESPELDPGYYHFNSLNVSYTIDEAGTYDLRLGDRPAGTVEVEAAYSDVRVIVASSSVVDLVAGEEAYVVGSIYQAGTIAGSETVDLTVENAETGEEIVLGSQKSPELDPGYYHFNVLNVSYAIHEPGTYDLRLGDRPAGTVEVEAAYSDIQVIAASTSAVDLVADEEAFAIGSVYQAGTIAGSETIDLIAENVDTGEEIVLGSQESSELDPGYYHFNAVNVSYAIHDPGTYDLRLGDRDAGTVEVLPSESDVRVIAASVEEIELVQGETTFVIGSIYQAGTDEGPQRITLQERNLETNETRIVGEQTVSLQPGFYHFNALNVSYTPENAGSYELTLGDRVVGAVAVDEAITDIRVIGASVSAIELIEGEELFVTGSIYQAGTVAGDRTIELTAENVDTGAVAVVGSQETDELQPGFYHLGALNVSYTPDAAGTYELTLGDRSAGTVEVETAYSDVRVIAASTSAVDLVAGEEAYVVGSVYQAGTIAGSETIGLTAENAETGEEIVLGSQESSELDPGYYHFNSLNVSYTIDEAGTYELRLGDRSAGTVEVETAYSDIQVNSASTSAIDLVAGEEAYVVGSVYQAGTIAGSETVDLTAENVDTGEEIVLGSQETEELAPGYYHFNAVNVSYTLDEAGTYDLTLGDRSAGTVAVEAANSDIRVIAAGTTAVDLFAGEEAFAIGSVYQAGTIAGSETVDLTAENVDTGEEIVLGSQETEELAPGYYHFNAVNVSYTLDEAGTYDLTLGDRSAGTVAVEPGTVEVEIVSVEGQGTGFDVETGEHLVYASHSASVNVDVESDVPLDEVTLLVSSQATTFAVTATGTHVADDRWRVDVPLDDIPDDGRYDLTVVAADVAGTGDAAVAEEVLVIDRSLPSVSVSIGSGLLDASQITVISDVPLEDVPVVEAWFIDTDGAAHSATVTMDAPGPDETRYTGTIDAVDSGTYAVLVSATDNAGNEASAEASAYITQAFTLGDGAVTFDHHGSSVEFHLAEDADQAIAEQELFGSFTAYDGHHDTGGALGVGFLTADLDPFIDHQLETGGVESATVSIAVDETILGDASVDEVVIQHYEPATGSWTPVETTYSTVDDAPMVSAAVTHFSTYGAFLVDETPPTVLEVTPNDGATVTAEDDTATVVFTYEDDRSGVDISSVRIAIDGTDVTAADGTTITSARAEHAFTAVAGETYEATLTVADRVGNERTQTVTFDVATRHDTDGDTPEHDDSRIEMTDGVGIVVLLFVALVIAVLLGAVAYRRRDR